MTNTLIVQVLAVFLLGVLIGWLYAWTMRRIKRIKANHQNLRQVVGTLAHDISNLQCEAEALRSLCVSQLRNRSAQAVSKRPTAELPSMPQQEVE